MAKASKGEALWTRLFQASEELQMLHEASAESCIPLQATFAQLRILSYIRFSPGESVKIREIADALHITPAAASQIVERMVQLGVVERTKIPGDRRSVHVTISPEGRECYDQSDAIFETMMKRLLRSVPNEKLAVFREVLDALLLAIAAEKAETKKTTP